MSDQMDKMESTQENGTERTAKEKNVQQKEKRGSQKASGTGKHRKAWIAAIAAVAVIGVGLYVKASSSKVLRAFCVRRQLSGMWRRRFLQAARWAVRKRKPMRHGLIVHKHSMSKEGDAVHKGRCFGNVRHRGSGADEEKADLDAEASEGSYQSALQQSNENQNKYSDALHWSR